MRQTTGMFVKFFVIRRLDSETQLLRRRGGRVFPHAKSPTNASPNFLHAASFSSSSAPDPPLITPHTHRTLRSTPRTSRNKRSSASSSTSAPTLPLLSDQSASLPALLPRSFDSSWYVSCMCPVCVPPPYRFDCLTVRELRVLCYVSLVLGPTPAGPLPRKQRALSLASPLTHASTLTHPLTNPTHPSHPT